MALNLTGLEYRIALGNLFASEQRGESFTARNAFAWVPMLEADGRDWAQSLAIVEWLDEACPKNSLLPAAVEDRFTVRELACALATELHAPLNLKVLNYLKHPLGHAQSGIDDWYRHWLGEVLRPLETRLGQVDSGDFVLSGPGLFEAVLIPQLYNARRFAFDLAAMPRITRIEAACLTMPAFARAHPDNQPDCSKKVAR